MSAPLNVRNLIENALREGLELVRSSSVEMDNVKDLFKNEKTAIRDDLVSWILSKEHNIYHALPVPAERSFPCWVIQPQQESEKISQTFFGERIYAVKHTQYLDTQNKVIRSDRVEYKGAEWDTVHEVQTWTINGILTPLMHQLAAYLIFRNKPKVTIAGVNVIILSGSGFDMQHDDYPMIPFVRILSVGADQPLVYKKITKNVPMRKSTTFAGGFNMIA